MGNLKETTDYKEFKELGYTLLRPINKEETKKNILHLYKDGNYVASIKRMSKGKFSFNRKSYIDKNELLNSILEYNKNLEFDARTYDPDMRDDYRTDIRIYETIRKFGFEPSKWSTDKLVADGIMGMEYGTVYDQERLAINSNSWINLYDDSCKTDETKCAKIRSMLFAIYAANIAKLCESLKNTGKLSQLKDIKVNRLNEKTMTVEEISMLDNIKGILEKGISILSE